VRAGIPVILLIQHRLQHRRARGGQRRAHSLLHHAQPQAAAEHARGQAARLPTSAAAISSIRAASLFFLPAGAAPTRP